MVDVVVVFMIVAFFVLAVGYVRLCDRIVGSDPSPIGGAAGVGADGALVDGEPDAAGSALAAVEAEVAP